MIAGGDSPLPGHACLLPVRAQRPASLNSPSVEHLRPHRVGMGSLRPYGVNEHGMRVRRVVWQRRAVIYPLSSILSQRIGGIPSFETLGQLFSTYDCCLKCNQARSSWTQIVPVFRSRLPNQTSMYSQRFRCARREQQARAIAFDFSSSSFPRRRESRSFGVHSPSSWKGLSGV